MLISEQIRAIAPFGAKQYRLLTRLADGSSRLHPSDPASFYMLGEAPNAPVGRYTVCFYDGNGALMTYAEDAVQIVAGGDGAKGGGTQVSLSLLAANGPAPAAPAATSASERRASGAGSAERPGPGGKPREGQDLSPELGGTDLDYRRYMHAMDLEERQQEFIKNSAYVTEVGELFSLNRIMRREMMEMQRIIVQQSQQAHKDIELMKTTLRDMFQIQKEVLDKAAELLPKPPPPAPPDYVGLGHTALGVVKELGVALLNRQDRKTGLAERSAPKAPQLPVPPSAESADAGAAPPPDIIDRMIAKLKGAGDVEMAIAMSAPENWKALMEDLLAKKEPAKTPEPPAPAEPPAKVEEGASDAKPV
ncbi:MAG: hypothetical protein U1A78_19145 [Polyangia bacterium]